MFPITSFTTAQETEQVESFLKQGYILQEVQDLEALTWFRHALVEMICHKLEKPMPENEEQFLNELHQVHPVKDLNTLRIHLFNELNKTNWARPTYYHLVKSVLNSLVGSELAMQSKLNLSIQYPEDKSSLLEIHADTWSSESPFQVVVWIPMVNVYDTKSMYILNPEKNRTAYAQLQKLMKEKAGSQALFEHFQNDLQWLEVPFGKALIFSPNLLHGNVINQSSETRWSFNCRFKGLFTPYASVEKKLGGFYLPITTKVVSRIGMNYNLLDKDHES